MDYKEGLPVVKLMMLLSSMAPLFLLIGLRGVSETIICEQKLWIIISGLIVIPYLITFLRIRSVVKANDILTVKSLNLFTDHSQTQIIRWGFWFN